MVRYSGTVRLQSDDWFTPYTHRCETVMSSVNALVGCQREGTQSAGAETTQFQTSLVNELNRGDMKKPQFSIRTRGKPTNNQA